MAVPRLFLPRIPYSPAWSSTERPAYGSSSVSLVVLEHPALACNRRLDEGHERLRRRGAKQQPHRRLHGWPPLCSPGNFLGEEELD